MNSDVPHGCLKPLKRIGFITLAGGPVQTCPCRTGLEHEDQQTDLQIVYVTNPDLQLDFTKPGTWPANIIRRRPAKPQTHNEETNPLLGCE